MTTANTGSN